MSDKIGKSVILVLVALARGLILNYPTMLLWNFIMPKFGLTTLTFWEMYCLQVLLALLFNSGSLKVESK